MKILGIESSCDETAAAVIEDGRKTLSNVINTQVAEHGLYGGVVPEIASRRHTENIVAVVDKALADADMELADVDAIAVTAAPGLIGALLVGVNFAKGLALATGKPLVPVHHLRSHIAANYLAHPELQPPFLCLVVSGGHSHIVEVADYTEFRVLGKTRDDAAGEAFDKSAKLLGLGYPGGPALSRLAEFGNPQAYALPRPLLHSGDLDFSFAGLKTAVLTQVKKLGGQPCDQVWADLAASTQAAIVEVLVKKALKALDATGMKRLVVAGGVGANASLRQELNAACAKRGVRVHYPELHLCTDNGAMIALAAAMRLQAGKAQARKDYAFDVRPRWDLQQFEA